jgi:hypothetical protein
VKSSSKRTDAVFLNVPFDEEYRPLFQALIFTIWDCGFTVRCALENADSGEVRVQKIARIIGACRYGIHDISRTQLDPANGLPRFNMPFELGLFLGARWLGVPKQRRKQTLILDQEPYRYQKFISDIAGQDIKAHGNDLGRLIGAVRNWLRDTQPERTLPGASLIAARYARFRAERGQLARELRLDHAEFVFNDFTWLIRRWLEQNER